MKVLESDICASILRSEVLDDLVDCSFAWAVACVSGLDELTGGGRDIDNHTRAGRCEGEEFSDDVEDRGDVSIEGSLEVCSGDIFAWRERMARCYIGDQNFNLANLPENGRDAFKVGDRGGVRGDFGLWILGFELRLRFAKHFLASLDQNQMFDASFGERLGDGEANAGCLSKSVHVRSSSKH